MKLILAPSAQTHTSIAVVWDKPEDAQSIEEYVLYLNGREAARVKGKSHAGYGVHHPSWRGDERRLSAPEQPGDGENQEKAAGV